MHGGPSRETQRANIWFRAISWEWRGGGGGPEILWGSVRLQLLFWRSALAVFAPAQLWSIARRLGLALPGPFGALADDMVAQAPLWRGWYEVDNAEAARIPGRADEHAGSRLLRLVLVCVLAFRRSSSSGLSHVVGLRRGSVESAYVGCHVRTLCTQ